MAKKKKHKNKKIKHNNKDVKNTTEIAKNVDLEPQLRDEKAKDAMVVASEEDQQYVSSDVKFSLILLTIIVFSFIVLSIVMRNKTVSDQLYGLIKINF